METNNKRKRGRPKAAPFHALNFRCESDLYETAQMRRGKESLTRYLNNLIRKGLMI